MKKTAEESKKEKKAVQAPPVLERILQDKVESDSVDGKTSWGAAWCTDTISD